MSGPGLFVGMLVAYLASTQYIMVLNDPVASGAGFWPAAGVTVAVLLLVPTRRWVWVIAAVVVAEFGGGVVRGYPWVAAACWTAGNALGPLVGASLVRRFVDPAGALTPLRRLVGFLAFAVAAGSAIGASIGSIGSIAVIGNPLTQVWPKYVMGDALGVLVTAPLLLTIGARHPRRSAVESFVLALLVLVVPVLTFRNHHGTWDVVLPYLIMPLLTWAALRYGWRGAVWTVFWVAQVANWATASGYGPFALAVDPTTHGVTVLQLFVAIAAVSAFILAAVVEDLQERDEVERALTHQARHDVLTDLPNRVFLNDHLERALERQAGRAGGVVLLLCDLDDFKVVNDGLGHQAGDQVLVEVARRLRAALREGEVVARLGGDEFVVLVEDAVEPAITSLTERLFDVVAGPFVLPRGHQVDVGLSIGLVASTSRHDAETLLRDADAALYRAKRGGRGRAERFNDEVRVEALERLALPQDLRVALGSDQLFCLHQPEIDLATGTLFTLESLVRWSHPQRGLISPDRFVPLAESAGLAGRLFSLVLEETLRAQRRWATQLGFHPSVSVNLSPRQLNDAALPATVAMALTRSGLSADDLWLEVTESAIADSSSFATLTELHELGVHLAIDDFGTGWSSLARLSDFPWDLLKIDRSFIARLVRGGQAEHVIRATIVMAHALGVRTVAEGVETLEQLEILRGLGCDIAQGFLFSEPIPASEVARDLASDGRWLGSPAGASVLRR